MCCRLAGTALCGSGRAGVFTDTEGIPCRRDGQLAGREILSWIKKKDRLESLTSALKLVVEFIQGRVTATILTQTRPSWPWRSQLSVILSLWSVTLQPAEQLALRIGGKRSNCETTTPYGPNPPPIHHPQGSSVNILTGNVCKLLKTHECTKKKKRQKCETRLKSVKRKWKAALLYSERYNENIKGGWASAHRSSLFCNLAAFIFSRRNSWQKIKLYSRSAAT